jgi:pimeloyl-ACP methyl ester carboxylesterase
MRIALIAVTCAAMLGGCQMPRPVLQSTYDRCPTLNNQGPSGSILFITLRQPDCTDEAVTKLTDLRARGALYAGLKDGTFSFYPLGQWLSALESQAPDKNKPLIIFIHGYRNTNAEALSVAARIQGAAEEDEPVVAITWPSYARYTSYYWDETNAEWAANYVTAPVLQIASRFPHVIIIAHSMGNRIALAIMSALRQQGLASHVDRLIMASPDVDRASVRSLLFNGVGANVTVYGSRKDQALSGSWRLHSYPRAGDLTWWVTGRDRDYSLAWIPNVEVIDTTAVDHSRVGHSAFIETREGAEDLCRVVHGAGQARLGIEPLEIEVPHAPKNYFRLVGTSTVDPCSRATP